MRQKFVVVVAVVGLISALAVAGCGSGDESSEQTLVVASTTQIGDLVHQVGGTNVKVVTMAPRLVNPHTYVLTSQNIADIGKAKAIFISGGDMDPWMKAGIEGSRTKLQPINLSESAKLQRNPDNSINWHWYLDMDNVIAAAGTVRDKLSALNPDAKDRIAANTKLYVNSARSLDDDLQYCAQVIKPNLRKVVAGHNELVYLASRYDIDVVAQITKDGEDQPPKNVDPVVKKARAGGAKAILNPWGESDIPGGEIATALGVPKTPIFTDSISDPALQGNTLLRSIGYSVNQYSMTVTKNKQSCS